MSEINSQQSTADNQPSPDGQPVPNSQTEQTQSSVSQSSETQSLEIQALAEKAGLVIKAAEEELGSDEIESDEIDQSVVSTGGNALGSVWARTIVIALGAGLGVFILALLGSNVISSLSDTPKPKPAATIAHKPQVINEPEDEVAKLKSDLALSSQKAELQKLNEKLSKASPTPRPKTTPAAKPKITPAIKPKTIAVTPKIATPKTTPTTRPTATVSKPAPKKIKTTATPQTKIVYITRIVPKPIFQKPNLPSQAIPVPAAHKVRAKVRIEKQKYQPYQATLPFASSRVLITDPRSRKLVIGTSADARVQSAIVLTGSNLPTQSSSSTGAKARKHKAAHEKARTYPIKFTQSLKNPDATVVIPKNSLLITKVKALSPEGWLELLPVAIVISSKAGGTVEKTVPEGTILVRARDGSALKGEFKTISGVQGNVGVATQTKIGRTSRLPVRHGIDPISNDSTRGLNQQQVNSNKQGTLAIPAFTVDKDAAVQIYVNRSFDL